MYQMQSDALSHPEMFQPCVSEEKNIVHILKALCIFSIPSWQIHKDQRPLQIQKFGEVLT